MGCSSSASTAEGELPGLVKWKSFLLLWISWCYHWWINPVAHQSEQVKGGATQQVTNLEMSPCPSVSPLDLFVCLVWCCMTPACHPVHNIQEQPNLTKEPNSHHQHPPTAVRPLPLPPPSLCCSCCCCCLWASLPMWNAQLHVRPPPPAKD